METLSKSLGPEMLTPEDLYRRLAGETEARNVEKRQTLTADDRRMTAPWLTADVPEDQQRVRR